MTTGSYTRGIKTSGKFETKTWGGTNATSLADRANDHPYNSTQVWWWNPPIKVRIKSYPFPDGTWSDSDVYSFYGSNPSFVRHWNSNHDLEVVTRLKNLMSRGSFNALVSCGELKETWKTIATGALSIRKMIVGAAKRRGIRRTEELGRVLTEKKLSSRFLEYEYGIRPLIGDVFNACELAAYHLNKGINRRYRARFRIESEASKPVNDYTTLWLGTRQIERQQIIAKVREFSDATLAATGVFDPFAAAWELVPYSFVIDWFIPVGDFLEAANFLRNTEATYCTTQSCLQFCNGCGGSKAYPCIGGEAWRWRATTVNRYLTPPRLSLPRPVPLTQALSYRRACDAVALLLQLRPGSRDRIL